MSKSDLPQFDGYEDFLKTSLTEYGDVNKHEADVLITKKLIEVRKLLTAVHYRAWPDVNEQQMSLMTSYSLMDRVLRDIVSDTPEAQREFLKQYITDEIDGDNENEELLRTSEPEELKELFGGHLNGA